MADALDGDSTADDTEMRTQRNNAKRTATDRPEHNTDKDEKADDNSGLPPPPKKAAPGHTAAANTHTPAIATELALHAAAFRLDPNAPVTQATPVDSRLHNGHAAATSAHASHSPQTVDPVNSASTDKPATSPPQQDSTTQQTGRASTTADSDPSSDLGPNPGPGPDPDPEGYTPVTRRRSRSKKGRAAATAAAAGTGDNSSAQQHRGRQQQQQAADKKRRPRAVAAPQRLIDSCGRSPASLNSDTSIVLILTTDASQPGNAAVAGSSRLPRPSANNSRSMTTVADLLSKLQIQPPPLPHVYNHCNTVDELVSRLAQRNRGVTDSGTNWAERLAPRDPAVTLGSRLVFQAATIAEEMNSTTGLNTWSQLLTPHTSCLNGGERKTRQAESANNQRSSNRCVLRLDFATPLVRRCIQHWLTTSYVAGPPAPNQPAARQPQASLRVEPYRLPLVAVRVSGFAIGPTDYDSTGRFTNFDEPHGNWRILREWLITAAPHCTPSMTPIRFSSRGVGAVDFVLEETHRHELHALHGKTAPDYGVTRPLNLTLEVRRQSATTACSSCGEANHRARDCKKGSAAGQRTCKYCFATDHATDTCTAPRKCKMCDKDDHTTLQCRKYRPSWVEVAKPKQGAPQRPPAQSSTFAADRVAQMRNRAPERPAAPTTSPPAGQRPPQQTDADYPPLPPNTANAQPNSRQTRSTPRQHAWQQQQQQQQQQSNEPTILEKMVTELVSTIKEMQRAMEKQQERMDQQQEWMKQMMERFMGGALAHQPHAHKPGPMCDGTDGGTPLYNSQPYNISTAAPALQPTPHAQATAGAHPAPSTATAPAESHPTSTTNITTNAAVTVALTGTMAHGTGPFLTGPLVVTPAGCTAAHPQPHNQHQPLQHQQQQQQHQQQHVGGPIVSSPAQQQLQQPPAYGAQSAPATPMIHE